MTWSNLATAMQAMAARRFWAKVACRDQDECWEWQASRHKRGYAYVKWKGRDTLVHRVALSLIDDDWNNPLDVLHKCDNPICCNPAHLWRGTHLENMQDKKAKGRANGAPGTANGAAKLSEAEVLAIRSSKKRTAELAVAHGVSEATVRDIRGRRLWRHIP